MIETKSAHKRMNNMDLELIFRRFFSTIIVPEKVACEKAKHNVILKCPAGRSTRIGCIRSAYSHNGAAALLGIFIWRYIMKFLESDLEDLIYQASQNHKKRELLNKRGIPVPCPLKRQVPLGSYGTLDLLAVYGDYPRDMGIVVYELKKGELNADHLMQLCRYITALKRTFNQEGAIPEVINKVYFMGYLVGKSINTSGDFPFLINETKYKIGIYTYSFDMERGLLFENQSSGWKNNQEKLPKTEPMISGMASHLHGEYFEEINHHKQDKNEQTEIRKHSLLE